MIGSSGTRRVAIGLAVGEGTGPELAAIFEAAVSALGAPRGFAIEFVHAPRRFRTFGAPEAEVRPAADVERESDEDARDYEAFVRALAARGCRVAFRTAMNAQPLYEARERMLAVKVDALPAPGGEILLVRDEAQGFYAGRNEPAAASATTIRRTCEFTRERTFAVLDYAREIAARRWGAGRVDHALMAYKFHLLDTRFAAWVAEYGRARGAVVRLFQPDTMNRHLLRGTFRGNLLIVGGNEWGDIMHAELVARAGLGRQEQCCTRNVYLAPGVEGFVELQTVHGSADDIAGRGEVNPTATLRAAAAALEEVGCAGAAAAVEHALAEVAGRGLATPDAGGRASTRELVEAVIAGALEAARRDERPLGPEEKPARVGALVVVDAQGDVCGPGGRFAELGLVDAARAEALGERLVRLVAAARAGRVPVVFVRTLDVAALLPAGLAARGRLASARGAEPFGAVPLEGEAVIAKRGHDALHRTELEARLRGLGAARIALAGAFTDLSIDATARTAREAGFEATVVEDATLPLERAQADALGFLRRYYGVDIATTASLEAAWRRERADDRAPARGVELAR